MDFSYRYTDEQQDFRAELSAWLDRIADLPADEPSDGGSGLRDLARRLGGRGWLAPSEPAERGGGALDSDLTVVLLEELNRRGLLFLLEDEAQSLRTALIDWNPRERALIGSLALGERAVWRHRFTVSPQPGSAPALDLDSVGITAAPDADGYVLNGAGMFSGAGRPDILWTLALLDPDASSQSAVCLIVDASSEGISYPSARSLSHVAPRPVRFEDVWVLRSDALGPEGEGHRVLAARVSLDPRADLPTWVETETEELLGYARSTEFGGRPLAADPIRARILVEAYIASRVSRLLRMRASWLRQTGDGSNAADSLSELWRRSAASALSESARQIVGPRALLSPADPSAAAEGRFDRLSRREIAEREAGDPEREAIATELELSERREATGI